MKLMDKAQAGEGFQKPDISQFVPPEQHDAVARVKAAGMKVMYSPEMKGQIQEAIASKDPAAKKLADSVTGLLLILDQQSRGGLPEAAIFPGGMELLGEAAEVLTAAGQPVSQQDYNDAALLLFANLARKLGASDEDVMGMAEQMVGGQEQEQEPPPQPEAEQPVQQQPQGY